MRFPFGATGLAFAFTLTLAMSCKTTQDSKVSSEAASMDRAEEIHKQVFNMLDQKFPKDKGTVWSWGTMSLEPDWIIQSPENLWGVNADSLAKELDCKPSDPLCDKNFRRLACSSDADCQTPSTHCGDLLATVSKLGDAPKKLCLAPADILLNRFYRTMIAAESELDIASLSMPNGRFRTATVNALTYLSQKPKVPKIRMFFSGADAGKLNFLNPPKKALEEWIKDVKANLAANGLDAGNINRLQIDLGWLSNTTVKFSNIFEKFGDFVSWNHTKIIAADGKLALVGGHNMWDADYLRANPIFDLSMEYRGQSVVGARDFMNKLWGVKGVEMASYPSGKARFSNFFLAPSESEKGTIKAIGIGRLGVYGSNPSDEALKEMINAAQHSVFIDQQDFYNQAPVPAATTFAMDAIVNAASRGVTFKIVQSNKFPLGGYGTVSPETTYKGILEALVKSLKRGGKDSKVAEKEACAAISYAPFRFSSQLKEWPNVKGPIGTHTKFLMVDEAAFYVGSHNLYQANLQEYGNIITDVDASKQILSAYWDKIWEASKGSQLPCPY